MQISWGQIFYPYLCYSIVGTTKQDPIWLGLSSSHLICHVYASCTLPLVTKKCLFVTTSIIEISLTNCFRLIYRMSIFRRRWKLLIVPNYAYVTHNHAYRPYWIRRWSLWLYSVCIISQQLVLNFLKKCEKSDIVTYA